MDENKTNRISIQALYDYKWQMAVGTPESTVHFNSSIVRL